MIFSSCKSLNALNGFTGRTDNAGDGALVRMLDDQISGGLTVFNKVKQGAADSGVHTMECEIPYLPIQ